MFAKSGKNLPTVLLVEDSPDDIEFATRALAKSGIPHRLVVADEGGRALELLTEPQAGETAPLRPDLILLDLNIPGISGRELLTRIKSDADLCTVPVVVLSTSTYRSDVDFCYRAHANSYHAKSDDLSRYQNIVRQIVEYWLGTVVPAPEQSDALQPA